MKASLISVMFFLFSALLFLSCRSQQPLHFLPINDPYLSSVIEVVNINDFELLARKSSTGTVYYNDENFFIQLEGIVYSHISRGYKSFREYREGRLSEPEEWAVFKPGYSD